MRWERLCKTDWQTLRTIQEFKLSQFIRKHVYPFSPYYRELFDTHKIDPNAIRTIDDLRRIPFTTKADLTSTPERPSRARDFILQPDKEKIKKYWPLSKKIGLLLRGLRSGKTAVENRLKDEYKPVFFTSTTGRSSEQVSFFYSLYDVENLKQSGRRLFHVGQADPEFRVMNMFPYAPHLAFWQTYFGALAVRCLSLATGGGRVMGTASHMALIERLKPDLLIGVPSYVYHVLRNGAAEGRDFSSIRRIILGAEKVPVGMKEKMVELLGSAGARAEEIRIIGTYGFTEAKCAWGESPTPINESSGFYTYPDREIFEIINPETGEPVGEGEDGEIVYTGLDARGSVVLRYRTGDVAKGGVVYTAPCKYNGMTVPRISSTISRVSNTKDLNLTKIKGTLVNLDAIAHVLMGSKEVEEWAIEIKKQDDEFGLDTLILYVAVRQGHAADEGLKRKLSDMMHEASEIRPNVIIYQSLDEMIERTGLESNLKEQRFFDRRPGGKDYRGKDVEKKDTPEISTTNGTGEKSDTGESASNTAEEAGEKANAE